MTHLERKAYWRNHVEAAQSHPDSLAAYCRETELCYQSLLSWKRRFAAPRFIELAPPIPEAPLGLSIHLGELRIELPASCPSAWAGGFVAALHEPLGNTEGHKP